MAGRNKTVDFGSNPYENPNEDSTVEIGILNETSKSVSNGNRVHMLTVNKLIPNEKNNKIYDIMDLEALAKDISERGIQQPLIVRLRPDGKYTIISGHRRLAAYNLAVTKFGYNNGECLPCLLQNDIHSDLEEREALILNNLQRDKSDFNRMMEIVEMRKCAEERRDLGEKIENEIKNEDKIEDNESFLEAQKAHYEALKESNREIRKLRHDMKNHIYVMQELSRRNKQNKLQS